MEMRQNLEYYKMMAGVSILTSEIWKPSPTCISFVWGEILHGRGVCKTAITYLKKPWR
ncbi:unnamed protein product [Ranitomeya imitator]|uniref:Uncharacterized protein n=1 Tax=Ranitomeya imitator TaxID=111125 RepID=A0ABN9ML51_9NEOB|nr:unnamed protein product [Ranitomeya imitator]